MSIEQIFDSNQLQHLASTPQRLRCTVNAESYRSSSGSVATQFHFAVKSRGFTVQVSSTGLNHPTETYTSLETLRWSCWLVRHDAHPAHDLYAAPIAPNSNSSTEPSDTNISQEERCKILKSLSLVVHKDAKPSLAISSSTPVSVTLDVKLQLLSSKISGAMRLFLVGFKQDGSTIPGVWALSEPIKVVAKLEAAQREMTTVAEKRARAMGPSEQIARNTAETQKTVHSILQEVLQLKMMIAGQAREACDRNLLSATEDDEDEYVDEYSFEDHASTSEMNPKKRGRSPLRLVVKPEPAARMSTSEAFECFMAGLDAECDDSSDMMPPARKMQKLLDDYLAKTKSPRSLSHLSTLANQISTTVLSFQSAASETSIEQEETSFFGSSHYFASGMGSSIVSELRSSLGIDSINTFPVTTTTAEYAMMTPGFSLSASQS